MLRLNEESTEPVKNTKEFSLNGDAFCRILQNHENKKSSSKTLPPGGIEPRASDFTLLPYILLYELIPHLLEVFRHLDPYSHALLILGFRHYFGINRGWLYLHLRKTQCLLNYWSCLQILNCPTIRLKFKRHKILILNFHTFISVRCHCVYTKPGTTQFCSQPRNLRNIQLQNLQKPEVCNISYVRKLWFVCIIFYVMHRHSIHFVSGYEDLQTLRFCFDIIQSTTIANCNKSLSYSVSAQTKVRNEECM